MHERKMKMNELSDGIIALPGGFGTLEELFEILTWVQLGGQNKPIGILNVDGYYDLLIGFVDSMVSNGFLRAEDQKLLIVRNTIEELLQAMDDYSLPDIKNKVEELGWNEISTKYSSTKKDPIFYPVVLLLSIAIDEEIL